MFGMGFDPPGLAAVLRDLSRRWRLTVGEPIAHDGICGWVAPARTTAGVEVVLKLGRRDSECLHEAEGLRRWAGAGTALLHRAEDRDDMHVLLLERCVPGTMLRHGLPEREQDVVVAGLLRRLWQPAGPPFRPLHEMCDLWAAEFEEKYAAAPEVLDPGLARAGIALFRSLPRTAEATVLLGTDVHGGNILAAEREPWLVIDPKPYLGDPAYDVLQHMLNCDDRLYADPAGLADRMAGLTGLDPQRLRLWLFARCVQESPERPFTRAVARRIAP
jgi:streptomycin 6-kinase